MKYFFLLSILISCGSPSSGDLIDEVSDGEHRVFITSTTTDGNLGGITGGDSICSARAEAAGLKRTYKAILSDGSSNAKDRLTLTGAVFSFAGSKKTTIVDLGADLWNGNLLSAIAYDELGNSSTNDVWTGTDSDGNAFFDRCSDWSTNSSGTDGLAGDPQSSGQNAFENGPESCDQLLSLYCISI